MTPLESHATVGELVRERPSRARVFESLHIDYCCGGKLSLAQACERRGLSAAAVLDRLRAADEASEAKPDPAMDPATMSLADLAAHIVRTHHAFLRAELPRLDAMTEKVHRVHGGKEPRLADVRRAFVEFAAELPTHMTKEERVLFPWIRALEAGQAVSVPGVGLDAPIAQMEAEHAHAGELLATLRGATDDFRPPDWACNTYRAMLYGLEHLEADMFRHVHLENNILFPRALKWHAVTGSSGARQ